jgi:hypothetical protein
VHTFSNRYFHSSNLRLVLLFLSVYTVYLIRIYFFLGHHLGRRSILDPTWKER